MKAEDRETPEKSEDEDDVSEKLPFMAAFDERLPILSEDLRSLVARSVKALEPHIRNSSHAKQSYRRAKYLLQRPEPLRPLVMVLGDSGVGKSRLLSSVTDIPNLVRSGAAGQSCTCVPAELVHTLPDQKMAFAATIKFFDKTTCRGFLEEQIRSYYLYHFEREADWPFEIEQECSKLAQAAKTILRSLFCDKVQFSSPVSTENYLQAQYDSTSPEILDMLERWCSELLARVCTSVGVFEHRVEAASIKDLNAQIDPFLYEQPIGIKPTLWALVDHVRIGARDSRILNYVRLLDLPGISDTNSVRANIANAFVHKCDAMWVVTTISRPISDTTLERIMANYGVRFSNNIAIVVTSSDTGVDDDLAREMKIRGQSIGDYWTDGEELKKLKHQIDNINAHLRSTRRPKKRRLDTEKNDDKLREQRDSLTYEYQERRDSHLEILVEARNAYISRSLKQDKQRHLLKGTSLSVFCVSNTHYQALNDVLPQDSWRMQLQVTGIPALRSHALTMAAPTIFRELIRHFHDVESMLQDLTMWVTGSFTDRDRIMETVNGPRNELPGIIEKLSSDIMDHVQEILIQPLNASRQCFINSAISTCSEIDELQAPTVRAFFRKDGRHRAKGQTITNWNESFMKEASHLLNSGKFNSMVSELDSLVRITSGQITVRLEGVSKKLKEEKRLDYHSNDKLDPVINSYIRGISHSFGVSWRKFEKELRNAQLDATKDLPSAYFTIAMSATYDCGKVMKGKGCVKAMLGVLKGKLSQKGKDSPYAAISKGLLSTISKDQNDIVSALLCDLDQQMGRLSQVFEGCLKDLAETTEEAAARAKLGEFLPESESEIKKIMSRLGEIEARYQYDRPDTKN